MKTLIQKELRENLKLALPGLLIFSALLGLIYRHTETQPLVQGNVLGLQELFCNAFGLALGWFQIFHERHRDLWAFMIHRPLTRTRIFFAKVIAGLILYSLAAGLPLLVWVAVSASPGHFASPFEWAMALPIVADLLMGMVWYFAGMLTGLRQARWYVSRGLGLVAALFIYMLSGQTPALLPGFWQQFVIIAIGGTILAVAAWGAFQGDGSDRSQPAWGRRALSATLALALVLAGFSSGGLLESLLMRNQYWSSTYFEIMHDGTICKVIQRSGEPAEIVSLAGAPIKDPDNGRNITLARFDKLAADSYPINVEFGNQWEIRNPFGPGTRFFSLCQNVDRTLWYWKRDGELAGYDTSTRRLVGSIAPDDFPSPTARFLRPQLNPEIDPDGDSGPQSDSPLLTLATPGTVCRVNLEDRTARTLFTTTNGDDIGGARDIDDQAFVVVTRSNIEMMTLDGQSVWKIPFKSVYPGSMWVKVSRLAGPQDFAVWTSHYARANPQVGAAYRWYSQVAFVSGKSGVLKTVNLPPTTAPEQNMRTLSWQIASLLMPPVPIFYHLMGWQYVSWIQIEISSAMAAVCALAGWLLGRRYHFSVGAQLGWAVFHLLCGFPAFIAFLCVQDWPVRMACPNCGKMRIVERARCEHCEAGFASPDKNGTEIFQPLTANNLI